MTMTTAIVDGTNVVRFPEERVAQPRVAVKRAIPRLRMTKRGRAVLLVLIATPLVIIALLAGTNAGGANAGSHSTPLASVTVAGGQTLWQLAREIAPSSDPRDVVADIMSTNHLQSADVQPGDKLEIPAQYSK
jgi:LysM repeat protein